MSTSDKDPRTIRQGGPGASHENAKDAKDPKKPGPDDHGKRSHIGTGGGETDTKSSRDERLK